MSANTSPGSSGRIDIDGSIVSRAYSLTGPATLADRGRYSIAVRRQRGQADDGESFEGVMSGYLHRRLKIGDVVELKAPSGSFVLPRVSPQPLILLAGDIGITPFINLLETLPDGDPLDVTLYYGNFNGRRTPSGIG